MFEDNLAAENIVEKFGGISPSHDSELHDAVLAALRKARREGELAMRERAAEQADGDYAAYEDSIAYPNGLPNHVVAQRIRALEPETPEAK